MTHLNANESCPLVQGNIGLVRLFLSGAFAGATAAGLVTPADVVKTRVQVENSRYTSIPQCAATVLREEGIAAFWKGVVPRMAVQVPNHPPTHPPIRTWGPHAMSDAIVTHHSRRPCSVSP